MKGGWRDGGGIWVEGEVTAVMRWRWKSEVGSRKLASESRGFGSLQFRFPSSSQAGNSRVIQAHSLLSKEQLPLRARRNLGEVSLLGETTHNLTRETRFVAA